MPPRKHSVTPAKEATSVTSDGVRPDFIAPAIDGSATKKEETAPEKKYGGIKPQSQETKDFLKRFPIDGGYDRKAALAAWEMREPLAETLAIVPLGLTLDNGKTVVQCSIAGYLDRDGVSYRIEPQTVCIPVNAVTDE